MDDDELGGLFSKANRGVLGAAESVVTEIALRIIDRRQIPGDVLLGFVTGLQHIATTKSGARLLFPDRKPARGAPKKTGAPDDIVAALGYAHFYQLGHRDSVTRPGGKENIFEALARVFGAVSEDEIEREAERLRKRSKRNQRKVRAMLGEERYQAILGDKSKKTSRVRQ